MKSLTFRYYFQALKHFQKAEERKYWANNLPSHNYHPRSDKLGERENVKNFFFFDAFNTFFRVLMKVHACSWRLFLENHRHFHLRDVIQPLFQGTLQRDEKERALSRCTAALPPPSNEIGRHSESTASCRLKLPTLKPNPHPSRWTAYLLVSKRYIWLQAPL